MADRPDKADTPYNMDPGFERAVLTLCARSPKFWGSVGQHLNEQALGSDLHKLAYRACRAVAQTGRGPDSVVLVLQRLRRWVDEGKTKIEDVYAVSDLFDAAEDAGLPRDEDAAKELVPVLKARARNAVARATLEELAKPDTSFQKTAKLIKQVQTLGEVAESGAGTRFGGSASFDEVRKLMHLQRLPTGIDELDIELDGGMPRGCLGIVMGGPGGGKSMTLSHIGTRSIRHGLFAAYATFEVPVPTVTARIAANLTSIPINAILEDASVAEALLQQVQLGPLWIKEFTPLLSTMEDIEAWVAEIEAEEGRPVDVLLTDYGDKLGAPKNGGKEAEHGYGVGRIVFERMRVYAHERKLWHWTGSQTTRGKDNKRKKTGIDDIADSMHKARVADLLVSCNVDEEQALILWNIAKNRHGAANKAVGPLPHEFHCGRVAPVLDAQIFDVRAVNSLAALKGVR